MHLSVLGSCDVAVDLGTTNVVVYVRGRGIALSEPSVVAVDQRSDKVRAVGADAKRLLALRGDAIVAVRPIRGGVITDFERAEEMLRRLIGMACRSHRPHPRVVVIGTPRAATSVERRAAEEACLSAGARHACLIEAPMAAALGAGLEVGEPAGSLVVAVGGGICEAAVISLGQIAASRSIRAGGDVFDDAIRRQLKRRHGLLIDEQTAEEVRLQIGSTDPADDTVQAEVHGREMRSGLPTAIVVSSGVIREALERPVTQIVDAVRETLFDTPPELAADVIDRGIVLTGGGSLLRGLKERLRHETQMPVHVAELPLTCVAAGAGAWLEELASDGRFDQEVGEWAAHL